MSPPLRPYYRSEIMRREVERREMEHRNIHNRLGERLVNPRALEVRLAEQRARLLQDQERERAREREMIRRQMEVEHREREQQLAQQLSELRQREAHERHLFERQRREAEEQQRVVEERERQIRDRERQIKEAEMRERERLATLEKQRDKEFRERERRYREELERELKEKERQLRQQEKELRERERKIREDQERHAKLLEEQERQRRIEEQQRIREEQERKEQERRLREQEELKMKLKEEQERVAKQRIFSPQFRLDAAKRMPAVASGSPETSSVFGRLGGRDGGSATSRSGVVKLETAISPNVTYRRYESTPTHATRTPVAPYGQGQQARPKEAPIGGLSSFGAIGYPPLSSRASSQQYAAKTSPTVSYGPAASSSYYDASRTKHTPEAKITSEFFAIASKALSQIAASSHAAGSNHSSNPYANVPPNPSLVFGSSGTLSGHGTAVGYPRPPPLPPSAVSGVSRPPSSGMSRFPPHKLPPEAMRYNRRLNPRGGPAQKKGMNY